MSEIIEKHVRLEYVNPIGLKHLYNSDAGNYRQDINAIKKFIALGGKIQPIKVRRVNEHHYILLDGFCRYWACKELGLDSIKCMYRGEHDGVQAGEK